MSIRRQFVLVLAAFAVVLAVAFGWVSRRIASDALEDELDRRLVWVAGAAAASGIQASSLVAMQRGDEDLDLWTGTRGRLAELVNRGYVDGAWIFNGVRKRAVVSHQPADSVAIGTPLTFLDLYDAEIRIALADGSASSDVFSFQGRPYKYGFVTLDVPELMMAVLMPADFLVPVGRLSRTLLWGSILALALAVGLGTVLAANVARPLEGLARAALRIQRGRMDRPVELDRRDELGRLAQAMERMRNGIVERDEQLRLMLAQVAHEIRNPLGGLELFASAAAETEDPVERRRHMARVRAEVAALNRIIDDFLTFARPLPTDPEPTDLREPVEGAVALVRGEVERAGGTVDVDLPDEPLMARADPDQVKRAVLNLLRNAAQVSDRVVVSGSLVRGEVVVRVGDDGPGVPEEARSRIFDPFVTDKEQGAGLGLAIVRKVAEAHGGRVEVAAAADSGIGSGAEFRIYFRGMEDYSTG